MSTKYRNKFYNHFEKKHHQAPPQHDRHKNFLMRFQVRLDYHQFLEHGLVAFYFKKGSGQFLSEKGQTKAKDGHFLVLNPSEGREFINDSDEYLDILSFDITNKLVNECNFYLQSENLGLLDDPFGEIQEDSFFIEDSLKADHYTSGNLLQEIYELSQQEEFELFSADELTISVIQSLFKDQKLGYKIVNKIEAKKVSTKLETLKRLLIAYEFIHDNVENPISINELSIASSLSRFHLYDSFKKAFGKTPHQYINRLKIVKAKETLQKGQLSVSEVSDSFGFSDLSVFSKVFKKAYGRPPSHYLDLKMYS